MHKTMFDVQSNVFSAHYLMLFSPICDTHKWEYGVAQALVRLIALSVFETTWQCSMVACLRRQIRS